MDLDNQINLTQPVAKIMYFTVQSYITIFKIESEPTRPFSTEWTLTQENLDERLLLSQPKN